MNVKRAAPPPVRKMLLDEEDEEDEELSGQNGANEEAISSIGCLSKSDHKTIMPGRSKPGVPPTPRKLQEVDSQQDISSIGASKALQKAAEELDPSIFDYDSFHDAKATVTEAKKVAARQEAIERKPKYINNLLDAAARRKQDQLMAKEKLLQREREAEGDEFADKEKFVSAAYKAQQEETRKLVEEEKKKAEEEERRRKMAGGGMQGFYKSMMDQSEQQHREAMEAAAELEKKGGMKQMNVEKVKTDAELAAELKAKGVNIHINEEGQFVDKRELLSAGLNVAPSGKHGDSRGADHLRSSNRPAQSAFHPRKAVQQQAQRERQSRMMEEQLAAQAKRQREEEEEEKARLEKAAKSQKTERDVSDAKARYLARKAARERGEG